MAEEHKYVDGEGVRKLKDYIDKKTGENYTGVIAIEETSQPVFLEGTYDAGYLGVYGTTLTGYRTGLFDYLGDGKILYGAGRYKLMLGDVYVGDCIIEAVTTITGENFRVIIKRVAGSDYYFAKAQQLTLEDGEEYYNTTHFDVFLFDVNTMGGGYDAHVINHNPHKNDDWVEVTYYKYLQYSCYYQGLAKILREYYEGCRRFDYANSDEGDLCMLPVIASNTELSFMIELLNGTSEVSVLLLTDSVRNNIDSVVNTGILEGYVGAYMNSEFLKLNPKKTVYLINEGTECDVPIVLYGVGSIRFNDGFTVMDWWGNGNDVQCVHLKPYEVCRVDIIAGTITSELEGGPRYAGQELMFFAQHDVNGKADKEALEGKQDKATVTVVDCGGGTKCNLGVVSMGGIVKIENGGGDYYGITELTIGGFTGHGSYVNTKHHEVLIEWDCGVDDMTLVMPDTASFHWANDEVPTFKAGWHYQLSVTYWAGTQSARDHYLGVCVGFPCEVV